MAAARRLNWALVQINVEMYRIAILIFLDLAYNLLSYFVWHAHPKNQLQRYKLYM